MGFLSLLADPLAYEAPQPPAWDGIVHAGGAFLNGGEAVRRASTGAPDSAEDDDSSAESYDSDEVCDRDPVDMPNAYGDGCGVPSADAYAWPLDMQRAGGRAHEDPHGAVPLTYAGPAAAPRELQADSDDEVVFRRADTGNESEDEVVFPGHMSRPLGGGEGADAATAASAKRVRPQGRTGRSAGASATGAPAERAVLDGGLGVVERPVRLRSGGRGLCPAGWLLRFAHFIFTGTDCTKRLASKCACNVPSGIVLSVTEIRSM